MLEIFKGYQVHGENGHIHEEGVRVDEEVVLGENGHIHEHVHREGVCVRGEGGHVQRED